MKVMQIMAGAALGGAETYFCELVIALHQAGLTQVAVTRPGTDRAERLIAAGVELVEYGFPALPAFFGRLSLRRIIARHRPELIQAWQGRAASLLPAPGTGTPPSIGWFGGYYDLRRYSRCRHFVGVTRDIARHIVSSGAQPTRVHVIHTFALLDDAPAVSRDTFTTPWDAPLLLALARLHPKKGIDTLLRAIAMLPGMYLWIAGTGPMENELFRLAASLDVTDRVRFLGWRTDRAALLRAADIVVVPSRYEPFGNVMVEAWQTGKPLIAAAAAGPAAYVEDGRNGLLVAIDDPQALAMAIRRLTADEGLRARLVEGGKRSFESTFTKTRIVDAYQLLYRTVAEARR